MAENKRITLHPIKEDGTLDLDVNLYPKTLKTGIVDEEGTEVAIVDQTEVTALLEEKVDKVEGKELSTNDFTNEDKQNLENAVGKLATIEEGAEANVQSD